jgi:hypothetical protein
MASACACVCVDSLTAKSPPLFQRCTRLAAHCPTRCPTPSRRRSLAPSCSRRRNKAPTCVAEDVQRISTKRSCVDRGFEFQLAIPTRIRIALSLSLWHSQFQLFSNLDILSFPRQRGEASGKSSRFFPRNSASRTKPQWTQETTQQLKQTSMNRAKQCGRNTDRCTPAQPSTRARSCAHHNTEATQPSMTRVSPVSFCSRRRHRRARRVRRRPSSRREKRKKRKRKKNHFFFAFLCSLPCRRFSPDRCGAAQLDTEKHNGKRFWQAFRRLRQEGQ